MPFALDVRVPLPKTLSKLEIRKAARSLMKELTIEDRELSIVLCDDETIHALNRDFRHKDKPTDVLAFALSEGEFGDLAGDLLGDVVISVDTTLRQAEEVGKTTFQELAMLLVHGTLHLLGWDHETAKKDRLMRAETDRLLLAIGIPPVAPTADPPVKSAAKAVVGPKGAAPAKGAPVAKKATASKGGTTSDRGRDATRAIATPAKKGSPAKTVAKKVAVEVEKVKKSKKKATV
jgi:probable rRNA maturation factor